MWFSSEIPFFFYFFLLFISTVVFSFLFLSYLGLYGVFTINFTSLFFFWVSLLFYIDDILIHQSVYNLHLFQWFYLNYNTKVSFSFLIDTVSFSFMLLTTTIGFFVYAYAFCYFRYEPLVERFILFLSSFIISMLILVSSGNLIMLFLGWELIGLTSFLLINFWVARVGTLKAAFKAFSFNKISDFFLLMGIVLLYNLTYDLDIMSINSQVNMFANCKLLLLNYNVNTLELVTFLFLSCAFIKSAQFGPHIWLPDSMEAPVPASSLIHSATLVSAGIFLILRFYPLFEASYYAFFILPLIGSLTAAYGGVVGAYQSDIKRILAYSTISHCGFLMLLTAFFMNEYVVLYLYIHGFFKASVFMCVGNVIRISKNYQDFRRMGSFFKYLPFECFMTFVCLSNLAGLPFSLGFYIKHLIFLGYQSYFYFYFFIFFNTFVGAISGLFYSYRIFYYVFFDFKKAKKPIYSALNRDNLFSYYYTNTSFLSNLSIFSLVITSYIISFYFFTSILSSSFVLSDFYNYGTSSNFYTYFNHTYTGTLFNFSYLNWFVLLYIWSLLFLNWRTLFLQYLSYHNLNTLVLSSLFFYINYAFII